MCDKCLVHLLGNSKWENHFNFKIITVLFQKRVPAREVIKFAWVDWQRKNNSLHHQNIDHITKFQQMNIKLCYWYNIFLLIWLFSELNCKIILMREYSISVTNNLKCDLNNVFERNLNNILVNEIAKFTKYHTNT